MSRSRDPQIQLYFIPQQLIQLNYILNTDFGLYVEFKAPNCNELKLTSPSVKRYLDHRPNKSHCLFVDLFRHIQDTADDCKETSLPYKKSIWNVIYSGCGYHFCDMPPQIIIPPVLLLKATSLCKWKRTSWSWQMWDLKYLPKYFFQPLQKV